MGTVLRLHKEADNNIKDWVGGTNRSYGSDVIDQIEDPGGARADKEITSIPSPFARIDLACSAFREVADKYIKNCPYKEICFVKEDAYLEIKESKDLSFIRGNKNE